MLKTKTINNITVLRVVAFIAIVSFSFEITSTFFVSDDFQIDIVDVDLEDDSEQDEEFDITYALIRLDTAEIVDSTTSTIESFNWTAWDQHLNELPNPPPDLT